MKSELGGGLLVRIPSYKTLVLLISISAALGCKYDREFVIVEGGAAQVGLALPESAEADEKLAAEELCAFVKRMSGAELEIVSPGGEGNTIYLGRAGAFADGVLPAQVCEAAAKLEPEAYLRVAAEGDFYLIGGSAKGALWAVYGVLHELGCRWYMPGPIGEVVPNRGRLSLNGKPSAEKPDFPYRQIWYSWGRPEVTGPRFQLWKQRNRLANPHVMHGHNLTHSMPESASFERRPELYSLIKGKREKSQICTTNPEAVRLITQTVNEYFDKHPDTLCYSLCPDDNDDFCECETCTALDTGAFDVDRQRPVVSDRYVTFLNQVAEGIQERHPGKMVSMYAYVNHSTPPEYTKVSPHVVIFFTSSMYCGGHGIGDAVCASRMKMRADLKAWCDACPNVYIYEYDPIPYNMELPWPLFGARAREMPVYREFGIQGLTLESHCSWATLSPNHWVSARCLWDADIAADELLRDFCDGFFGAMAVEEDDDLACAAQSMYNYFSVLEGALASYKPRIEWGHRDIPLIFTDECAAACRASLNDAMEAARRCSHPEAPAVRVRLNMIDLGFQYLEAYLEFSRIDREGGTMKEIKGAYDHCQALVDELIEAHPDFIEPESVLPDLKEMLSPLVDERYSAEFGLVTKWNAIGPFPNPEGQGHERAYEPEKEIDLKASYEGAAGKVSWKQISTGEGRGYVNLLHHFQPADWVTVYALGYLHADRDMDVQLRAGSNDQLKLWLDGKLLWNYGQDRTATVDEDIIPVHLKAGSTPVLLKISQTGNNWGFYFRVTDTEGNVAKRVTVELEP